MYRFVLVWRKMRQSQKTVQQYQLGVKLFRLYWYSQADDPSHFPQDKAPPGEQSRTSVVLGLLTVATPITVSPVRHSLKYRATLTVVV